MTRDREKEMALFAIVRTYENPVEEYRIRIAAPRVNSTGQHPVAAIEWHIEWLIELDIPNSGLAHSTSNDSLLFTGLRCERGESHTLVRLKYLPERPHECLVVLRDDSRSAAQDPLRPSVHVVPCRHSEARQERRTVEKLVIQDVSNAIASGSVRHRLKSPYRLVVSVRAEKGEIAGLLLLRDSRPQIDRAADGANAEEARRCVHVKVIVLLVVNVAVVNIWLLLLRLF